MRDVYASAESWKKIDDGQGYQGNRFLSIWVGTAGNVAVKNKDGSIEIIPGVPGGAFFAASGNFIGTLADGTTAKGLFACGWGGNAYDVNS